MNFFFRNLWIIAIILTSITFVGIPLVYLKGQKSSKWKKRAQKLDRIWFVLGLVTLGILWIEMILSAYTFIKVFK